MANEEAISIRQDQDDSQKMRIEKLLSRNVEEVIDRTHLEAALRGGKKSRVKLGIDPTGEKIHIGRAIALWKLKEFQNLGHQVILIIGDFTALIGDPSDKLQKRPMLTSAEIEKNLKNYLPQIGVILDLKKTEVRRNSEWLSKLPFEEVLRLTDLFSVQQMIERRNFKERWEKHEEVGLREFIYPLMQGYDSVAVKADVELGGTDQLFNLLAGRKIQERYGQKPQDVLITKMLLGLDGRKMSTSWGNVVNIADAPEEQFGKIMSLLDSSIGEYLEIGTDLPLTNLAGLKKELKSGTNPKDIKSRLGFEIVRRYHGEKAAHSAQENFEKLFSKKEIPNDIPELKIKTGAISVLDLVLAAGVAKSKGEAKRLIEQGGVEVGGVVKKDPAEILDLRGGEVARIGKKRFFRIKI
jgi:tyrosyl-tRNA synthetase